MSETIAVVGVCATLLSGCIGEPVNSPTEGYTGRQPNHAPPQTVLTGRVLDLQTSAMISGARVADQSSGMFTVSDSNGTYLLPAIRASHANLVISGVGYDTTRMMVQLNGGEVRFDLRLRATIQE